MTRSDPLDSSEPVPPGDATYFDYLCRVLPGGTVIRQGVLAREKAEQDDLTRADGIFNPQVP